MSLIDTHCHIYLEEFDADQKDVISHALEANIDTLLLPNVDVSTVNRMLSFCDQNPEFAFPMMGLHPTSVNKAYSKQLKQIESYLNKCSYCAIGEIGIDLYWDKTHFKEQKKVFEEQLQWSIDMNLPVSIHTREAFAEVFDSIYKVGADKLYGVFHSFSGDDNDLNEITKLSGFKLGINGVVTFKNSHLSKVLQNTDINRLVLETDAPYLAPVPYRGKRNEPAYIVKTAEKIAEIYDLSYAEVATITQKNSLEMFRNINKTI
ncbi:TatD family hydrolase [Parabacteroides sp. OttesenSCG-928-G21]|nr:TatD family hydrolase [Parabacteroides sp. OttesenSCG-928-G21]